MSSKQYKAYKSKDRFKDLGKDLDTYTVTTVLQPHLRARFGEQIQIQQVAFDHISKGVFACKLQISSAEPGQDAVWRVVAKKFSSTASLLRAWRLMQLFWENGFSRNAEDSIFVAEPIAVAESVHFVFMEMVPGTKLRKVVKSETNNTTYIRQFARTLAKLHKSSFGLDEKRLLRTEYSKREGEREQLIQAFPELEESLRFVVKTSQRIERRFENNAVAPVHGDYNLGQLHVEGESIWLLDFGNIMAGDPAWDVGNVLALSLLNGEKTGVSNGAALLKAFQDEYFSVMDRSISKRVPLYEAYYFLTRACKYQRTQAPSRVAMIEDLVERAVECVERMN
jgi:aminoglycoside phosphotransferase (APT) family kinase protein